jgi:hypothetical protein
MLRKNFRRHYYEDKLMFRVRIPFLERNYEEETAKLPTSVGLSFEYNLNYLANVMPKWNEKNEDGSDAPFVILFPILQRPPKAMTDDDPDLEVVGETEETSESVVAAEERPNTETLFRDKTDPKFKFAAQFAASVLTLYEMCDKGVITQMQRAAEILHFASLVEKFTKDQEWGHKVWVVPYLRCDECSDTITLAIKRYREGNGVEWYKKMNTLAGLDA